MRFPHVAVLVIPAFLVAACSGSDEPTRQWELSGFSAPESALPDPAAGIIYVSNIADGGPAEKNGTGFVSKASLDGKMISDKWVTGLNAPKGLALAGNRLYVADVDQLVEIDVETGNIAARHEAPGAEILNDAIADSQGHIYVSDWAGNAIWRLADGRFEKWVEGENLHHPNGLVIEADRLVIATWGRNMKPEDFSTEAPGNLITVSLADKTIANLGNGKPVGNLDGLVTFDSDSYLVTDWVQGKVIQVNKSGDSEAILTIKQGTADLGFISGTRTAIIPMMLDGTLVAYRF